MTTLKELQIKGKAKGYTLTQLIALAIEVIEAKEELERQNELMLEEMWEERHTLEGHNNRMEEYI